MSDVYTKKRKRDDDEDVSQAETEPAVEKTALPEAASVDLLGWGPKYIGEEALKKYAEERDKEESARLKARLKEQKDRLEREHTLRTKAYNDIKDSAFRDQSGQLKHYIRELEADIQELKAENAALRQKECRCVG